MNEIMTGKALGLKTVQGRLLKAIEVAELLRVSERWVHKHMRDGTFPIRWFPIGERERVVDSVELDTWLSKIVFSAGTAPLPLKAVRKFRRTAK
ncbi:MAG: helix-turn-helix domain-containing protein [Treponema sp.]|jgi:predicted DNA-binding transcriptional regulator AlpA|nr:helix-turn-helix domain-containing protein [Treponema sp.]